MRNAFFSTLVKLAEKDPRIFFLTADLGYLAVEPFFKQFPKRSINVGVAEQNLVGIATGLAEAGFIPFIYSITPFSVLRPYEFIRNGPIYHQFPVRIIGIGGGLEYSHDGISHYGIEDVGVLRVQPGIMLVIPADFAQASNALVKTWDLPGPIYYRLGKDDQYLVPSLNGQFAVGKYQMVCQGSDLLFISLGTIADQVCQSIEILNTKNIKAAHVILSCLNPSPDNELTRLMASFPLIVTVEAHYLNGGIGSYVSELIAENYLNCRLIRCGINKTVSGHVGSKNYLYKLYNLSAEAISEKVLCEFNKTWRD